MPKVSVVIPTHNRATLLHRAVSSALTQTFSDLEVLIADDASSDATAELMLVIRDPRIKYLRHETKRGVSVARNTAISHASGEYIAFLDDDDEWLPEKLNIQLSHLNSARKSVGLICSGYYKVDSAFSKVQREVIPSQRGWMFESM